MSKCKLYHIDGSVIHSGSTLEMDDISVNINHIFTLIVYGTKTCKISTEFGGIVKSTEPLNLVNELVYTSNSADNCCVFNICYHDTEEYRYTDKITIETSEETLSFNLTGWFKNSDERLKVLLNNFGWDIDQDWYNTFASTHFSNDPLQIDQVYLNKKRKEMLLDLFNITQLKGSYNGIKAGINFFEFGNDVDLLEYWQTKSTLGSDNPVYQVFENGTNVDITTYFKTNYIALRYHINYQDVNEPFDNDGIPNMIIRRAWGDAMYVKLSLLKTLLERWFLPDDIKIIDIIGELEIYARYRMLVMANVMSGVHLDKSLQFEDIVIESVYDSEQFLQERKLVLDLGVYDTTGDKITFKNDSAHNGASILTVLKDESELSDEMEPWMFATGFWRGDCAIVGVKPVSINPDYKYAIALFQEEDGKLERLKYSDKVTASQLNANIRFCIRDAGKFTIRFYAFDHYGAMTFWDFEFDCKFPTILPLIQLWRPKYIGNYNDSKIRRGLIFEHMMQTNNPMSKLYAIDLADSNYDINDSLYHENVIRKYWPNDKSSLNNYTLKKLRNVQVGTLDEVPLSEYADGYSVMLFKVSDIPSEGKIRFRAFESENEMFNYYSVQGLITQINEFSSKQFNQENYAIAKYWSWDLQPVMFRNSEGELDTVPTWCILCFAKERGLKPSDFKLEVIESQMLIEVSRVLEPEVKEVVHEITPFYTYTIFPYFSLGPSMRLYAKDKRIKGELIQGFKNWKLNSNNIDNLVDKLKKIDTIFATDAHKFEEYKTFTLSSIDYGKAIKLATDQFTRFDVFRKSPIEYLYKTNIGHVFDPATFIFATVDTEWKVDNYDIQWEVINHLSQEVVFKYTGVMLKWSSLVQGIFDIRLTLTDIRSGEVMSKLHPGAITVQ